MKTLGTICLILSLAMLSFALKPAQVQQFELTPSPLSPILEVKPGGCGGDWNPVCAKKGNKINTYSNLCSALQDNAKVLYEGMCL